MYASSILVSTHWSMSELGDKMILDLGCMKTVAGTEWVNQHVARLRREGRFVQVVTEDESFRFGDGQITKSRYAVIMEAAVANIPCVLRVSVVSGNCPPLLSKQVCSALGIVIDTASHTLASRRHGVRDFGLEQSSGGHYMLAVAQFVGASVVPGDFKLDKHVEVMTLSDALGRLKQQRRTPLVCFLRNYPDVLSTGVRLDSTGMAGRDVTSKDVEIEIKSDEEGEDTRRRRPSKSVQRPR